MSLHASPVATPHAHDSMTVHELSIECLPPDLITELNTVIGELQRDAATVLIRVTGDDRHDLVAVSVERDGAERLLFYTAVNATATAWFTARSLSVRFGATPVVDLTEYSEATFVIEVPAA